MWPVNVIVVGPSAPHDELEVDESELFDELLDELEPAVVLLLAHSGGHGNGPPKLGGNGMYSNPHTFSPVTGFFSRNTKSVCCFRVG